MNPNYTRILRPVIALGFALGLSACASVDRVDSNASYDAATRAAPMDTPLRATGDQAASTVLPAFKVVAVHV